MAAAFITTAVDKATAAVTRDHQREKPLKEPERRRAWVRLAVVLTVLAFTIWAVEWIAVNAEGSTHVEQVAYDSKDAQAYFLPVPGGSFLSASSNGMIPNITCPCLGQPFMSWCNFIDFYLVTCNQESNYQLHVTPISTSTNSSSCQRQSPHNIGFACPNTSNFLSCTSALDIVYDFPDTKTYIETPNIASPFDVFELVSTKMLSNIDINNQTIYANSLQSNNKKEYNHSMFVLSLVQSMVAQVFDCNTSSTPQQFWDRANQCGWNIYPQIADQFNGSKFAFGMTINYQAYSTTCKPNKCNIVVKDNFNRRLLNAMGTVGGVGSLILLGIQIILWPIVTKIFKFPFEHDPQPAAVIENVLNVLP